MKSTDLRKAFLDFFASKGHKVIPSDSLLPENDPTVLFTTAGMQPLVPYLLGETHPEGKRLANIQKCVRTDDIEEVGDATHLTFFEMLGYWSLGDYFKVDSIQLDFEFFTGTLEIPLEKFAVSVFAGDANAECDKESAKAWAKLGITPARIAYLPKEENWWGPAGSTGPCGPDTEMFYWTGKEPAPANYQETYTDPRWVEIGNSVFMEYGKTAEGKFETLKQKNVDTGLGFERILTVLSGKESVYETDLFTGIIGKIRELAKDPAELSEHIIADHLRAATFIIGDPRGVTPSNVDQGYVVRKLIRRAIRHARKLGINLDQTFTTQIAEVVIAEYSTAYPELKENSERILTALKKEEEQFKKTLEKGEKEISEFLEKAGKVDGVKAFYFYETYGFPLELIEEVLSERGIKFDDHKGFKAAAKKHAESSRTAAAGKFKGGLADNSEETTALHTAAHLLLEAMRSVLGSHVEQRGSNITAERLRFDFSHDSKLTEEEVSKVEQLVNKTIADDLTVKCDEMSVEEAKELGATGIFGDKYAKLDKVKVYSIGDFSKEICGGPHVKHTGTMGTFKIKKQESSSAGVRRVKAVLIK